MYIFPSGKFYVFVYIFSEIEFHVAQAGLELTMDQRLVLNSWASCIHAPSTMVTGHPIWPPLLFLNCLGSKKCWPSTLHIYLMNSYEQSLNAQGVFSGAHVNMLCGKQKWKILISSPDSPGYSESGMRYSFNTAKGHQWHIHNAYGQWYLQNHWKLPSISNDILLKLNLVHINRFLHQHAELQLLY